MGRTLLSAAGMLALPVIVFFAVGGLLQWMSGKDQVPKQKAINVSLGYGVEEVESYWRTRQGLPAWPNPMSPAGAGTLLDAERRYLEVDLIFPTFYAGALAACLLWVWIALGRPFHAVWFMVPVVLVVLGDWTENLIQLSQMQLFLAKRPLQDACVAVASAATAIKVVCLAGSYVGLAILVVRFVRNAWRAG